MVQGIEKFDGIFNGTVLTVLRFCPALFLVRLDNRSVFSNRQFHSDIGIHMAVCQVVNNLSGCPAILAVRFVEFTTFEFFDNFFYVFGKGRNCFNMFSGVIKGINIPIFEMANGVAQINKILHKLWIEKLNKRVLRGFIRKCKFVYSVHAVSFHRQIYRQATVR